MNKPTDIPLRDEAVALIRLIYQHSAVGGNLHIVLADDNIQTHHVQWCRDKAIPENGHKLPPNVNAAEMRLADIFLGMTKTQRLKAMKLAGV